MTLSKEELSTSVSEVSEVDGDCRCGIAFCECECVIVGGLSGSRSRVGASFAAATVMVDVAVLEV